MDHEPCSMSDPRSSVGQGVLSWDARQERSGLPVGLVSWGGASGQVGLVSRGLIQLPWPRLAILSLPGPGEVGSDYSHMDNRSRKLLAGAEGIYKARTQTDSVFHPFGSCGGHADTARTRTHVLLHF
jgi:hypothetical protein